MKKVVDVGYLRNVKLDEYLKKNTNNFVILTDYACMECFKGDPLTNLRYNLSIISKYPNQVIILKKSQEIIKLKTITKGIRKRFIDQKQTKNFPVFCKQLRQSANSGELMQEDILHKANKVSDYFDGLENQSHENIVNGIIELASSYDEEFLKKIRGKGNSWTIDEQNRIMTDILYFAALLMKKHPDVNKLPDSQGLINHLGFRYAVVAYALGIKWIADGGIESVKKKKLRNDLIDINYITYASYFDGLLTSDQKMMEVYSISKVLFKLFQ